MMVKDDIPLNKRGIYTEITEQINGKGKFFLTEECQLRNAYGMMELENLHLVIYHSNN